MSNEEISCSRTITGLNLTSCMRKRFRYILITFTSYYFHLSPCSGLVVSGYSKHQSEKSSKSDQTTNQYRKFKKIKNGKVKSFFYCVIYSYWTRLLRFWIPTEICEDLLLCHNIWQNHQGQVSQVCGHVVSYRRNHGASHWFFDHQWCGDCLFWNQNHLTNTEGKTWKEEIKNCTF